MVIWVIFLGMINNLWLMVINYSYNMVNHYNMINSYNYINTYWCVLRRE